MRLMAIRVYGRKNIRNALHKRTFHQNIHRIAPHIFVKKSKYKDNEWFASVVKKT